MKTQITKSESSVRRPLYLRINKTTRIRLVLLTAMGFLFSLPAAACEACKKQQPKIFQGITHGAGPSSNWDYVIVVFMVFITLYSLYATVKCMIKPAENENQHIKRMILNQ
jgi:Sec-independent protein secretion pathway component TatC